MRKIMAYLMVVVLVAMVFTAIPMNVSAQTTIYILPGGDVDPASAPIHRDGDYYTFTDNIYDPIVIQKPGITLDGAGYTLDGMGAGFRAVWLLGQSGVTVTNLNVKGWFIGIQLITSSDCVITGNTVSGIARAGTALIGMANNNLVSDNTYTNCGYGIVTVQFSTGNTLTGNTAIGCLGSGISIERTSGNIVEGNTVLDSNYGMSTGYASGVTFTNNVMMKDSIVMWGNLLEHFNTHSIDTSNTVNGKPVAYLKDVVGGSVPDGAGQVILANCQDVAVKEQDYSHSSVGILLAYSSDCTIKENTASYTTNFGISLQYSSANVIKENMFSNTARSSVLLEYSNDNTVKENVVKSSEEDGIWLVSSNGNYIRENTVTGCVWGIWLTSSNGNTVEGNTVMNIEQSGIHLYDASSDNTVCKNMVKKNGMGVILDTGTFNNEVHHNNFFHNDVQALDHGTGNMWDDGSEGNYWSDYKGKDMDHDGIGDTPYSIGGTAGSMDNHPLMKPC